MTTLARESMRVMSRIDAAKKLKHRSTAIAIEPDHLIPTLALLERLGYACVQSIYAPELTEIAW